jgi:formiminoglutamase
MRINIYHTNSEQQSTSGTSFRQILEEDDNTDYLVLGISQGGNTKFV